MPSGTTSRWWATFKLRKLFSPIKAGHCNVWYPTNVSHADFGDFVRRPSKNKKLKLSEHSINKENAKHENKNKKENPVSDEEIAENYDDNKENNDCNEMTGSYFAYQMALRSLKRCAANYAPQNNLDNEINITDSSISQLVYNCNKHEHNCLLTTDCTAIGNATSSIVGSGGGGSNGGGSGWSKAIAKLSPVLREHGLPRRSVFSEQFGDSVVESVERDTRNLMSRFNALPSKPGLAHLALPRFSAVAIDILRSKEDRDIHPYGRGGQYEGVLYGTRQVTVPLPNTKFLAWLSFVGFLILITIAIIVLAEWDRTQPLTHVMNMTLLQGLTTKHNH